MVIITADIKTTIDEPLTYEWQLIAVNLVIFVSVKIYKQKCHPFWNLWLYRTAYPVVFMQTIDRIQKKYISSIRVNENSNLQMKLSLSLHIFSHISKLANITRKKETACTTNNLCGMHFRLNNFVKTNVVLWRTFVQ